MRDDIGVRESAAYSEPLRPWLPVDLLDNAARTISENKTIMLGLPVIAGIALAAVQAGLTQLTVPGGISGFFGAEDPFEQAGAAILVMYGVQLILFTVVSSLLAGIIALAAVRSQLGHRVGPRELLRLVRPGSARAGCGRRRPVAVVRAGDRWLGSGRVRHSARARTRRSRSGGGRGGGRGADAGRRRAGGDLRDPAGSGGHRRPDGGQARAATSGCTSRPG